MKKIVVFNQALIILNKLPLERIGIYSKPRHNDDEKGNRNIFFKNHDLCFPERGCVRPSHQTAMA
ncbi:hypothetical protein IIB34_06135 [PVC group bacterium]|nr:hypothetical protein [PVC group bacterium]